MKQALTILAFVMAASGGAWALEVGEAAPCVVLEHYQVSGESIDHCIRDHAEGQTHTIIEFFSITCSACAENLPKVRVLADRVTEQATTRLVSIDRKINDVKSYVENHRADINFEVAFDNERDAKKAYGVVSTPTVFVLNQENVIVYKHEGVFSDADLTEIENLIKSEPPTEN